MQQFNRRKLPGAAKKKPAGEMAGPEKRVFQRRRRIDLGYKSVGTKAVT
jgi:hypothetical protein